MMQMFRVKADVTEYKETVLEVEAETAEQAKAFAQKDLHQWRHRLTMLADVVHLDTEIDIKEVSELGPSVPF